MTKEEIAKLESDTIDELNTCNSMGEEVGHVNADVILCEFLTSLGYIEVVDAYESIKKWYA